MTRKKSTSFKKKRKEDRKKRALPEFTGIVKMSSSGAITLRAEEEEGLEIMVRPGKGRGALNGDRVRVVIKKFRNNLGKAEGEVLIVHDPKAVSDASGKIIVTVSTDPGWVHILRNAAGIIAERGSILSHTAIIARELGKPSIVNVRGAAETLRDGDYVSLDTDAGLVRILRKGKD